MGVISRILSYARATRFGANVSDVKHDPGGGALETAEHFQDANTDSAPLPGDYLVTVAVMRTGGEVVVGFVDPAQQQVAKPGEHRTYARDADGAEVAQIHLKNDGTILIKNGKATAELKPTGEVNTENASGYYKLQEDGTVDINGFTIKPDGTAESPSAILSPSVVADGKELAGHDHDQGPDSAGDTQETTGANN